MGKKFDVAIEVVKSIGYLATGGICFYLLSGGRLPFQTIGNAQCESTSASSSSEANCLEELEREYNAMTNNDMLKKAKSKTDANNPARVPEQSRADARPQASDAEKELGRLVMGKAICGGMVAELTPECLARIREIEEKRRANVCGAK